MRNLFALCSILSVILLGAAAVRNTNPEWKRHQNEFKRLAAEKLDSDQNEIVQGEKISLKQIYLEDLDQIDRCVACHLGIDIPAMAGAELPYAAHPGDYLKNHPKEKFGCTVCHEGQGLATNAADAHAVEIKFWEEPMLLGDYLYSNCAKCHKDGDVIDTKKYAKGKELFETNGCRGCHKVNGKGGHLGPDLSDISNASIYLKHPLLSGHGGEGPLSHEDIEQKFNGNLNLAFIYEAVRYPKAQPANSGMVDYKFDDEEAMALSVYLKSLMTEDLPASFVEEKPHRIEVGIAAGKEIYESYCVACHGEAGIGTNIAELGQIGPAVGNQQFLSIADMPMLTRTISEARSGVMPAWGQGGGLSDDEIESVALYLKELRTPAPSFADVMAENGNAAYGKAIFRGNCSACHGVEGRYEMDLIGPSLRSPELLSMATKRFWYDTLANGREGTAMPSWSYLGSKQLADLIAYLESFKTRKSDLHQVVARISDGSADVDAGKAVFGSACAGCHGLSGEGGVGPSLNSKEFQALADARFMARAVLNGRAETAMPSFAYMDPKTVADIVAYVKTWQQGPSIALTDSKIEGSEYRGEKLFANICAQCHGENGQGKVGPAILGESFLKTVSDEFLWNMIAYGRSGTGMRGNLHGQDGFAGLGESEINDIVAYIRSFEDRPAQIYGVVRSEGLTANGEKKFAMFCEQCHGPSGAGGTAPAIGKKGFLNTVSDGFIKAMATNGRTGTEMKPFSPVTPGGGIAPLTDNDLTDIVSYLRTSSKTNMGYTKTVQGNAGMGQQMFSRICAQCHGKFGNSGFAPALTNSTFLSAASDSYLQATMVLGRHGTKMQSMVKGGGGVTELNSAEVNSIIVYLKNPATLAKLQ